MDNYTEKRISEALSSFRVDIRKKGDKNGAIYASAEGCKVVMPSWLMENTGFIISGSNVKNQLIKIKNDKHGTLILSFRGLDKRFNDERFPLYTDYKSIKIDGKEILSIPAVTWHDRPYSFELSVCDGQELTIEFQITPHKYYSEYELKSTLLKLFPENKDILEPNNHIIDTLSSEYVTNLLPKIVAVTGYYFTGSSTVIGFLNEFDNTTVMGYCETQYSVSNKSLGEITFFSAGSFFEFVDAFDTDNILEKDLVIKKFINDVYNFYDRGIRGKSSRFYNDLFLNAFTSLFYDVLDLDEYTINFMKGQRFPIAWNSADEKFQNCSFMKGKGISQYIFYKFKDISKADFDHYISVCLNSLFSSIPSEEYLVCDQLLKRNKEQYSLVDRLNRYMNDRPIKEICIYRDPRDRFLSAFRFDISWLPRDVDKYAISYTKGLLGKHFSQSSPNRLMIRFEDMVLKYEETTKKIMDFIGVDPAHHVAPKSVFDPAISVVNVGAYKQFVDQDFMKQIEEKMPEYCYYPEKEDLSQEALDLLKGTKND